MRRPDTGVPAVSAYEGPAVQRQPIEEEEKMLQAKAAETIQRQPIEEEEEELQMKSAGGSAGGHATATSVLPKGEADQVADQVMRMPQPRGPTSIQRLCPQCEEEAQRQPATEEEMEEAVQRAPSGKAAPAMTNRAQKAIHTPSAGTRLNPNVRSRVEPVLGRLMSDVRVHADDRSQQAAADIHAKAFTHKNHIFLGPGQSGSDLSLIAHEATHVVQQLGRGQQAGGKPGAVQRQDDESWSLEGLARTGREIYDAGAELVDDAVELGEEAVDTGRSIYRRGRRLYRRGRRVAEGVRQEAIVGAQGDESLHRITFDGSQVQVTGTPDFSAPAVSGLQPHARDARGIDYTNPIYQDQPNLGPIPEGEYYILPSEMQSSAAHGFNLSAWGRFRVILHPTALAYQHRVVLGRGGGFYLHEDANHNGTAGCIGLLNTRDNRVLLERIQNATSSVPVTVRYNSAPAPSEDSAAADCPECTPPLHRAGIDPPASLHRHEHHRSGRRLGGRRRCLGPKRR